MAISRPSEFYRHIYGGFYRYITEAYHSDDGSEMVVYEHVWPFGASVRVRPKHEFFTRFTPVDQHEVDQAMQGDQQAAQQAVDAAKASRRSAQSNAIPSTNQEST